MFRLILNARTYLKMLLSLCRYFRFFLKFPWFQANIDIFEHNSRAYSRIFRTLCISNIFRNQESSYHKHIQTPRYIHNTTLNIFTKAPSWTFDTVLNALHS